MTPAERKWLRRQLQKLREEIREDTRKSLDETLAEEARAILLERFSEHQRPVA